MNVVPVLANDYCGTTTYVAFLFTYTFSVAFFTFNCNKAIVALKYSEVLCPEECYSHYIVNIFSACMYSVNVL